MLCLEINKMFSGMHQCSILFDVLGKKCTGFVQVGLGWYHMPDILIIVQVLYRQGLVSILFDVLEKNCTGVVQVGIHWYHTPDISIIVQVLYRQGMVGTIREIFRQEAGASVTIVQVIGHVRSLACFRQRILDVSTQCTQYLN